MITKTYKINNDCIKQLQDCCDEHYQTWEDFLHMGLHAGTNCPYWSAGVHEP